MIKTMIPRLQVFVASTVLSLLALASCTNGGSKSVQTTAPVTVEQKHSSLLSPARGTKLVCGQALPVEIEIADSIAVDSVELFFNGKRVVYSDGSLPEELNTEGALPGRHSLRVTVSLANGKHESHSIQLVLLSDIIPDTYTYRVLKSYPHDVTAYTQGLEYVDGWLYEGTGQKGQSSLRRVSLEDGKIIQIRDLPGQFFGEGITLMGNKIYQLTYQAQVGFIYDRKTFEEVNKFYYQNKEGWGLCNNGKEIIMSDGSNVLSFCEPESFALLRQLEVYDNEGPVDSLNELEFINGLVYANRYYTDEIVIIDPKNGKIIAKVNLKGILPVTERKPATNVLNGIAWDKEGKRLFVTGKNWPKLYQVELIKTN